MKKIRVTTNYLEMNSESQFVRKTESDRLINVKEIKNDNYINFMLFTGVGLPWKWYSRMSWSPEKWTEYFSNHKCRTYLGFAGKNVIGYFELEYQDDDNVELKFFGLFPQFTGRGFGGLFLSEAIATAWKTGANRIWLHSCSNDHPNSIKNYLARGFNLYKVEEDYEEVPDKDEFLQFIKAYFSDYIDLFETNQL